MTAEQLKLPLQFRFLIEAASAEDEPNHHLERKVTGVYRMRVCLTYNRKKVGRRKSISLRTKNLELARIRRDRMLDAFERNGLIERVRIQRSCGAHSEEEVGHE